MGNQKTAWGGIEWLHARTDSEPAQTMSVGICRILSGKVQPPHKHYGEEQMLHILSGHGVQHVNGEVSVLKPGMTVYMPAGVLHDTANTGDEDIVELLVSVPVSPDISDSNLAIERAFGANTQVKTSDEDRLLLAAVETLGGKIHSLFHIPYAILNNAGDLLLQGDTVPPLCEAKCNPLGRKTFCQCLQLSGDIALTAAGPGPQTGMEMFVCPFGLVVFQQPIRLGERTLGFIRGGNIAVSAMTGIEKGDDFYDTPQSTALGIRNLLRKLEAHLAAYCQFALAQSDLESLAAQAKQAEEGKRALEENLRQVEGSITNLRINRHFLFNTLNSMADMALNNDGPMVYEAILQLANMFRYASDSGAHVMALQQEIAHVQNYLALQHLRFRDRLRVELDIDEEAKGHMVAANFLQPVVENAFVHGFKNMTGTMQLAIKAKRRDDGAVQLVVINNGFVPDEAKLMRSQRQLEVPTGHGLSLVYSKLRAACGKDFRMSMSAARHTFSSNASSLQGKKQRAKKETTAIVNASSRCVVVECILPPLVEGRHA